MAPPDGLFIVFLIRRIDRFGPTGTTEAEGLENAGAGGCCSGYPNGLLISVKLGHQGTGGLG